MTIRERPLSPYLEKGKVRKGVFSLRPWILNLNESPFAPLRSLARRPWGAEEGTYIHGVLPNVRLFCKSCHLLVQSACQVGGCLTILQPRRCRAVRSDLPKVTDLTIGPRLDLRSISKLLLYYARPGSKGACSLAGTWVVLDLPPH